MMRFIGRLMKGIRVLAKWYHHSLINYECKIIEEKNTGRAVLAPFLHNTTCINCIS